MFLTILLVILGLALITVFLNRKKDEEKARLGILGLTFAIVVLSIMRLVGVGGGGPQMQFDVTADNVIGQVTADRIARAATGKRVLIIADVNTSDPYAAARLRAVQARLLTHSMEVIGVANARPQSILEPGEYYPDEGLDARGVEYALRNHPDTEVLVSMAGFPGHNFDRIASQVARLEFFVFDQYTAFNWEDYVARGIVNGMILPPFDGDWHDTSGSDDELFDRRYVFVTRENLGEMRRRFEIDY